MKDIYRITGGAYSANTYILTDGGEDCFVVDCCDYALISDFLKTHGLKCKAVLLTHAHFDHCGEAELLQRDGAEIYIHEADVPLVKGEGNLGAAMGQPFIPFEPDIIVKDGDRFEICGHKIAIVHTPGHTPGGVCYIVDAEILFSGDTLFKLCIGRTDFPCGNGAELRRSIKEKLFTLGKDYKVYPGHDMPTSIFFDKENNPYV
ncbi:MAG: MBL fold metallo-hydrolase [Clostridia bacterium]|nr:MBL fold metallo-hydrolase [Clostridia bacterium]